MYDEMCVCHRNAVRKRQTLNSRSTKFQQYAYNFPRNEQHTLTCFKQLKRERKEKEKEEEKYIRHFN